MIFSILDSQHLNGFVSGRAAGAARQNALCPSWMDFRRGTKEQILQPFRYKKSSSHRRSIPLLFLLVYCSIFTGIPLAEAQVAASEVKAGFLLNFIRLTTFPAKTQPKTLTLCIAKSAPENTVLTALHGQHVLSSTISIQNTFSKECHVLYLSAAASPSEKSHFTSLSENPSVLSIVDSDEDFLHGGILQFFEIQQKIRFRVHTARLKRSSLRLSSQLLNLAELVEEDKNDEK